MKAILKEQTRNIPYAKVSHDAVSIVPCATKFIKIHNGINVELAVLTKDGLKIIFNRVGKVIKASNHNVSIKFNKTIGFDNELYALLTDNPNLKESYTLVLAYKEA